MSKKDYVQAAKLLAEMRMTTPTDEWVAMVSFCTELFARDNQLFDRDKFKEACYQ